jgi:hypothetical protein
MNETSTPLSEKPAATLSPELEAELECAVADHGPERAFETLARRLEAARRYPELFDVLVMQGRHRLGLPLIQIGPATDTPDELVTPYEDAIAEACRKVGKLFLADGDLGKAWVYLRHVGDTKAMAETLERIEPGTRRKDIDALIEIALHENVHPSRGLEMVVHHYGICSSITNFEQFHAQMKSADRVACARVLLDSLYRELLRNIAAEVERQEGKPAPESSLIDLIRTRPELFEDNAYYVDSSHLWSVVRFAAFLDRTEDLDRALELTEYGRRLSPLYKYESEAPFEDYYEDHAIYFQGIRASIAGDAATASRAAQPFIDKAQRAIEARTPNYPTRAVLNVLVRMGCCREAIDLAVAFDAVEGFGPCRDPGVYELCQMAGEHERLRELARARGDAAAFAAGLIQSPSRRGP